MDLVHAENVIGGCEHHPLFVGENHRLENVDGLGDVGHPHSIAVLVENIESEAGDGVGDRSIKGDGIRTVEDEAAGPADGQHLPVDGQRAAAGAAEQKVAVELNAGVGKVDDLVGGGELVDVGQSAGSGSGQEIEEVGGGLIDGECPGLRGESEGIESEAAFVHDGGGLRVAGENDRAVGAAGGSDAGEPVGAGAPEVVSAKTSPGGGILSAGWAGDREYGDDEKGSIEAFTDLIAFSHVSPPDYE